MNFYKLTDKRMKRLVQNLKYLHKTFANFKSDPTEREVLDLVNQNRKSLRLVLRTWGVYDSPSFWDFCLASRMTVITTLQNKGLPTDNIEVVLLRYAINALNEALSENNPASFNKAILALGSIFMVENSRIAKQNNKTA